MGDLDLKAQRMTVMTLHMTHPGESGQTMSYPNIFVLANVMNRLYLMLDRLFILLSMNVGLPESSVFHFTGRADGSVSCQDKLHWSNMVRTPWELEGDIFNIQYFECIQLCN